MVQIPQCSVCTVANDDIRKCNGCSQFYCSAECQHWDWFEENHKADCKPNRGEQMFVGREHKGLTKTKIRRILADGHVHGKPLTDRQRRYFYYLLNTH
jgi:MYND finger